MKWLAAFVALPRCAGFAPARRFAPARAAVAATAAARAGVDGSVAVRDAGDRGRGVFATAPIANGTYIGEYGGGLAETIDYAELLARYPDLEPEYCFELGDDSFLDAARADHWTRLMNHDATARANVGFEFVARGGGGGAPDAVEFAALRDIAAGDELVFDYGAQFWDGRSDAPAAGTDARVYAGAVGAGVGLTDLGVPLSAAAVDDVLRARGARAPEKRAALMRALDYFGVPTDAVPVPPPRWRVAAAALLARLRGLGGVAAAAAAAVPWRVVAYEDATTRQLARALRARVAEFDGDDEDLDEGHDPPAKGDAALVAFLDESPEECVDGTADECNLDDEFERLVAALGDPAAER